MANSTAGSTESFFVTGGTLPLDAGSYVVRQADTDLFESLSGGEFCYVLNTRQMGKSSLMVRTAMRLRAQGAAVAVLDLTAVGQNLTPEQWYDGLLSRLGRQLDCEDDLEAFYRDNSRLGPLQRFIEAIVRICLPGRGSLVIFVDEIDAVRSLPFVVDEFFAAIRECYNRRTEDPTYLNLTFCLLGVATPSDLVADTRMSPFNVGRRIILSDFTSQEAAPLAEGFRRAAQIHRREMDAAALLARVLYWTHGHPYMTQRLCRTVAEAISMDDIPAAVLVDKTCAALFFSRSARDTDDNLAFVRNRLLKGDVDVAALLYLYRRVRRGKRVADDETSPLISLLRLSGIVRVADGLLAVRNRIYARVFDLAWIDANMPDAEVRRQRAAYRSGVIRAAVFGGALAAALAGLAITSLIWKHRADASARAARIEASNARSSTLKALLSAQRERESEQRATEMARAAQEEKQKALEFGGALAQTFDKLTRQEAIARRNLDRASSAVARAKRAEGGQRLEMRRLNRVLYDATMNLVQREYEAHEYERMQELLNQTRDAEDRGFEWRFWQHLDPLLHTINAHAGEVMAVAASPDGKRFATGGIDRTLVLSDAKSGQTTGRWKEDADIRALAFSPDGTRVAVGLAGNDKPGRAVVRDAATGRALATLDLSKTVWDITYSHDGKRLATNGERVQLWNAVSGAAEEDYGPGGPAIAFSPNDQKICFSRWSESGKPAAVEVLGLKDGMVSLALTGQSPGSQVRAIAWSPDDSRIAAGSDDRAVRLWSAQTGQLERTLSGHTESVLTADFSPDGKRLLTSSLDDEARVWELDSTTDSARPPIPIQQGMRPRFPLRDLRQSIRDNRVLFKHARHAAFVSGGDEIVTGSYSGMVRLWRAAPSASYLVLEGAPIVSPDHVGAVAFAPDNRQIVSSVDSPFATLWDAASGARRRDLRGHSANISALAFFPDSSRIVSGGWDGLVKVWEIVGRRRSVTLGGHKGNVECVAVSSNGRLIASAGEDGTGIIWDGRSLKRIATMHLGAGTVHGIAISPDGAKIAVAQTDNAMSGRITLWEAVTGKLIRTVATVPSRIFAVRFSPDGTRLLAGTDDRRARIWDLSSGALLLTLNGHTSGVSSVAYSSDGRRVITGSFDTSAKMWDAHTGREILTLHHPTFVIGVALSPDRKRIVTACEDGSTRVWRAD